MSLDGIRNISTAIIIAAAAGIILLERKYPYTKEQKFLREGFFNDFFLYTIAQSFIMGIIISYIIEFIDGSTGLSRLRLISGWPVWLQVLFFVILHDLYIYWFHRWMHNNKFLWRFHEAHHTNTSIDWLAGSRSHAVEILINQTIEFAPIVLLGAAPETAIYKGVISAVWGMYIHSNIDVHTGRLQYFINGPEMHRWHHSDRDEEAYNRNFATKLAVWDWVFGTGYLPGRRKPEYYGLSGVRFPKNYILQFLFAFRRKN